MYYFVNIVLRNDQALYNMGALLCFVQVEFCSSGDNILLMDQIVIQKLIEIQYLRLSIDKCKVVYTKCILHLCMLIEQIQNYARIGITAKLDHNSHTFTVGLIS